MGRISCSKWIHHFSSNPSPFGFQASLPSNSITLWSLWFPAWHCWSGLCHFWHSASDSCTRAAFPDTITSLQSCYEAVITVSEVYIILRFMTFWTMLCLNGLLIQFIFWHSFLILLPGGTVKSGLHRFPFFTMFVILFFLLSLVLVAASSVLWHRLPNNPH